MHRSLLPCAALFALLSAGCKCDHACERPTTALTCESLTIVDEDGRPRIELRLDEGRPQLRFLDEAGAMRLAAGVDREGDPGLFFLDAEDRPLMGLSWIDGIGGGFTCLTDGRDRVAAGVFLGSPTLYLRDEEGEVVWSVNEAVKEAAGE